MGNDGYVVAVAATKKPAIEIAGLQMICQSVKLWHAV